MAVALTVGLTACSKEDDAWSGNSNSSSDTNQTTTATGTDTNEGVSTSGDVASFTVAIDRTALAETVTVDAADDDYIENTTFDETITITFSQTGPATVSGDAGGYVAVSGNDVVATNSGDNVVRYILKGTTRDGFFKLYSQKKQAIVLSGASITNPDGAAINNQSKKRTFIVLDEGTTNELTDGTAYADATDGEDMKGCLFSEGQLIFSGTGALTVSANCKAGIRSDDYVRLMPGVNILVEASSGNGVRGNDAVTVTGGVLNITVTGTAGKGISTDGTVLIEGGRTTIVTTGGYEYDSDEQDYSACAGIKADTEVVIDGGELNIRSTGTGGKGINTDGTVTINGGLVRVVTEGRRQKDSNGSVSPKGIKADVSIAVNGGQTQVRCSGQGDGAEGIESKGAITIAGGTVESQCYDDAINSKLDLTISGGYVYARGTNNDGIDSNGNVYVDGGTVIAEGAAQPECGIDAAEGYYAYMNGGTVVAIGGGLQAVSSQSQQASVTATVSQGTTIGLLSATTALLGYTTPGSNTGTALLISTPELKAGSSYTLRAGCTLTGGTSFYNLVTGCVIGTGSQSADVTATTAVSSSMGGGQMGGGGPGGRPGGW